LISQNAGSSYAIARLGPLSLHSRNSDANRNLPGGIAAARIAYPGSNFKAGHMINAEFGGNGQAVNNLTILSSKGNTRMTRLDNNVKRAVQKLCKLFEEFHAARIELRRIGICRIALRVDVVGGKWGANPPDSYITNQVMVTATFENVRVANSGQYRSNWYRDSPANAGRHMRTIEDLQDDITDYCAMGSDTIDNDP
jgi:hypothetical protein